MKLVSAAVPVLLALVFARASAQQPCDPSLDTSTIGRFGYRDRGDRCEGRFSRPVSGTPLVPVSLTAALRYDTSSTQPVAVSWSVPQGDSVRIVARSTRPSVYYQMDTRQARAAGGFLWHTDVLSGARNVTQDGLGLVATTRYPVGRDSALVYVAVRAVQQGGAVPCDSVRLGLMPGASAESVTVSVAAVSPAGERGPLLRRAVELGYGYYPARRRINVPLPEVTGGLYWVNVVAWGASRNPLELYVYRAPAARCAS